MPLLVNALFTIYSIRGGPTFGGNKCDSVVGACAPSAAPAGASPALNVGTTVFAASAAPRVPVVAGKLVGGGRLSLAADRGHVVVLNFWASWCAACRQESPVLSAAARHFQGSAVRFVGVDVGDDAASAEAFMRNFRMAYPSLFDPGDAIPLRFSRLVPVLALPYTLVISPEGRIRGRVIGAVSAQGLVRLIEVAGARPSHDRLRSASSLRNFGMRPAPKS